ncbi:MAG: peptidase M48 Ste24p [Chitinophagaceae bacterium]|nr:MAG: peptidase M48 Ste24p [Chitinophagaceae bacterium]
MPFRHLSFRTLPKVFFLLLLPVFAPAQGVQAQVRNPYDYAVLSHRAYAALRDSLKKYWVVPAVYKNKETQKQYKEFWDQRTEFIVGAINDKNFVREPEMYQYLDGLLSQLQAGNKTLLPKKPTLLIDRSSAVNAYSIGGGLIAVNLGLVTFAGSREEVALVLAHELAHDILGHADRSMRERAEWLTSEEYKKTLNEVLDSRYERYTRLKKVMEAFTFSRTRHSRYHEHEADSLAVTLLRNAQIAFDASVFLRLDSVDMPYQQVLKQPLATYFTTQGLPFEASWSQKRGKGLSGKNYSFQKSNELADSLKTHPDCKDRYEQTKAWSDATTKTAVPAALVERAQRMIIWNLYDNQSLTACLYRVMLAQDRGATDAWYRFMFYNVFAGVQYADNVLSRFNAINIQPKENVSTSYFELQTMLEQLPRERLAEMTRELAGQPFWNELPADAKGLRPLFTVLLEKDGTTKDKQAAAKNFLTQFGASMYGEFADHFVK